MDLPPTASAYERAKAVILPMPLEMSVSYGGGTAKGPEAIITASQQVELYDARRDSDPALHYGVHTLPVPSAFAAPGRKSAAKLLDAIAAETEKHLRAGKFVCGLGGEHTASIGVARGVAALGKFTLVHVDAHADLREQYEDNPLSHACAARRIAELPQCQTVLELGIRSTTREQMEYACERGIRTWYAWDIHDKKKWRSQLREAVAGRRVFFTFDVDGLDPAIVPATGTPEPNGLNWREFMRIVRIVAESAGEVAAMDCVELAPAAGLHHADFTVARAVYEMMTMFLMR